MVMKKSTHGTSTVLRWGTIVHFFQIIIGNQQWNWLKTTTRFSICQKKRKECFFFCYYYYAGLIDAWMWSRFINNSKSITKVKLKTVCEFFFFWTFYLALWTFWTCEKELLHNFSRLYWYHGCSSSPPSAFCFYYRLQFVSLRKKKEQPTKERKKKTFFHFIIIPPIFLSEICDFWPFSFFFQDDESLVV